MVQSQICLTFTALADPQRLKVLEMLRSGPVRAGELADRLQISPPTLSRHLRLLKQAGLVEDMHPGFDARVRVYSLRSGALQPLKTWLDETENMWAEQMLSFRAFVESEQTDNVRCP